VKLFANLFSNVSPSIIGIRLLTRRQRLVIFVKRAFRSDHVRSNSHGLVTGLCKMGQAATSSAAV